MSVRRLSSLACAVAVVAPVSAAAQEPAGSKHSPNMSFVTNVSYEARNGTIPNYGTDQEFTEINGATYGFFGSYRNGMQIVDVSEPENATKVGVYDCGITQGDVQVFRQEDEPGRVFATYTSDTYGDGTSPCYQEAAALGFDVLKANGSGKNGTFIVDVTNPAAPTTVSFLEVTQGSHNMTVHPSGNWLYNSNSDLITSYQPAIEYFDISDPSNPRKAGELSLPPRPGLGTESHDIGFNDEGTRAYSAALSQGVIIDTTDPGEPKVLTSFLDPAINVWHQLENFKIGDREFLIAEDEFAGAAGGPFCPNGGVHVYDVTGEKESRPEKVGYWNMDDPSTTDAATDRCTAHVFQIHEKAQIMTIAFYNGGVYVVDLSELAGVGLGPNAPAGGMKSLGFYRVKGGEAWSAKSPEIKRGKSFYVYGNDIKRGLDVYRFEWDEKEKKPKKDKPGKGPRRTAASGGVWLSPAQALTRAKRLGVQTGAKAELYCLVAR